MRLISSYSRLIVPRSSKSYPAIKKSDQTGETFQNQGSMAGVISLRAKLREPNNLKRDLSARSKILKLLDTSNLTLGKKKQKKTTKKTINHSRVQRYDFSVPRLDTSTSLNLHFVPFTYVCD